MIFPGAGGFDKIDVIKTERMVTVPKLEFDRSDLLENIFHYKETIVLLEDRIEKLKSIEGDKMSERDKKESDLCKEYLASQKRSIKDSEDTIIIIDNYLRLLKGEVAG